MLHLVGCIYYLYQWRTVKHISDNVIYLLNKYIKSVLWRVSKRLSYIQDAQCLKVNTLMLESSSMTLKKVFHSCELLHFISEQPPLIRQLNPYTRQLSPNNGSKPVLGCGTAGPTPLFVLQGRAHCFPLRALAYTSGLVLYCLQIQHGRAFPLYV